MARRKKTERSRHQKKQRQKMLDTHLSSREAPFTHGKMPCPDCQSPIVLSFEALFTGRRIFCSNCGISLATEVGESRQALAALKKAQALVKDAEHRDQPLGR